jgi:crotonobetainyl-CoA:carnitine CoA-transferase CaiB-like acyl-CoA transferase
VAILAALAQRERTGEGQWIDACLLDSAVAMMSSMAMNHLATGRAPGRAGNAHPNIVPYQVFACADGHVIIAVGNDLQFGKLCAIVAHPEWAADPRFATNAARVRHRETLVPMLEAVVRERTQAQWLAALEAAQIPAGPINRLDQVFADPQVVARGLRFDLPHPLAGSVPQVGLPFAMSGAAPAYHRAPPLLAADTARVLGERLGLAADAIDDLARRGVIQVRA